MTQYSETTTLLQRPLELPCGAVLKNRIAKSPMSDSLGDGQGDPTQAQIRLYERWAEGGVALSLIGEVQADPRFPEKPGNLVLHPGSDVRLLRALSRRASVQGAHIWPQLGHAGALAHGPVSQPKGPAALDIEGLQCGALSSDEIQALPAMYARAAVLAREAGFGGVQIHAGHGFLLSQFLSPLFNHRQDGYGGSVEARSRILLEIIDATRRALGPTFPIGVRINSTDQLEGGLTEADALEVVRLLDRSAVDLIDISGGTYFPGARASSDGASGGPYFLDFARRARGVTRIPVVLTGGFKRREQAVAALESGAADMVGLGRALVLNPQLPTIWASTVGGDPEFPRFDTTLPGAVTAWYTLRLTALAEEREATFDMDLPTALKTYETRDAERCHIWSKRFSR